MNGGTRLTDTFMSLELRCCALANRMTRRAALARFFGLVSRLGDGVFWYALIAILPLAIGPQAIPASLHMGMTALVALGVYYALKGVFRRPRPYRRDNGIQLSVPPLDEFSFPSGHTLQAVSFTMVAIFWYPALGWLLLPFTALVALSRVVLGLHYPSDILAAAAIGVVLAAASLGVVTLLF